MKFIHLICCLTLISTVTYAQSSKPEVKRFFFHSHGVSFQNFKNLDQRIAPLSQFQQPKNSTGTLQFGVFAERNKLISVYSINGGSSLNGDGEKKSTHLSFVGMSADVGYNLLKNTRISLYPFAGLGYEGYKVKFNRDISSAPFDSVLQSNRFQQRAENLNFSNSFMLYRLGMGLLVRSKKHIRNSIGLQVDYSGGFKENDWKINKSQTLLNSPKDKLSKLALSVLIRYQLKQKGRN